jgi:RimJ/RimL family protein N-acetyltransferase
MNFYKCLNVQEFEKKNFKLVPIRFEDRYIIMKWRNEQMYHLRQNKALSVDIQDKYFANVIEMLFDQDFPNQILFSFLENNICIGYGGLVHINWVDKNAEISFIMETELEKENFSKYWYIFLELLEEVAFVVLKLHKIFTFAFDLRPQLYPVLEKAGYFEKVRLKEHCFFEGRYLDVIINAKINNNA